MEQKQKKKDIEIEETDLPEKKSLDVSNAHSDELVLESDRPFLERFGKGFVNFWRNKSTIDTLKYIGKRLLLMVFTFLVIFLICFVLVRLLPLNPDSGMKDPAVFYESMVAQGRYLKIINEDNTISYVPMPVLMQLGNF
ncbi:MAG: hypothetical protein IK034_00185, partial [Bacilli bacterium]|nr:hypothetical protein [Bacilli bacterium]